MQKAFQVMRLSFGSTQVCMPDATCRVACKLRVVGHGLPDHCAVTDGRSWSAIVARVRDGDVGEVNETGFSVRVDVSPFSPAATHLLEARVVGTLIDEEVVCGERRAGTIDSDRDRLRVAWLDHSCPSQGVTRAAGSLDRPGDSLRGPPHAARHT